MFPCLIDPIHQLDRTDATSHWKSHGRFRCAIHAERGVFIQRRGWPLERGDGHGQRSRRANG